jgi:hypothetical protein
MIDEKIYIKCRIYIQIMENNGCDEVMENMQKCLMECKTNSKTHFSKQFTDLKKCENIRVYERSLGAAAGIQLVYAIHEIDAEKSYQIIYDTKSKVLTIKK